MSKESDCHSPQMTPTPPRGIRDADYAASRRSKPHLAFRLRSRAHAAAAAYRRLGQNASGPRVLDLGAAEGAAMAVLHRLLGARQSLGIEYADELIAATDALPEGCRLVQGDVTRPHAEVADESFDLVTTLAVLEHLAEPERLVVQARRALRAGGLFIASCPARLWDTISGAVGLHPDEHHEGHFDRRRFERLARTGGLQPLLYRRFMCAPIGLLPYVRIPVAPEFAYRIDRAIAALRVFDFLFVNQLFVARRP